MDNTKKQVILPPILQIGNVLLSSDILTEEFCCDLDACHGTCCVVGDEGAPVTIDEIAEIEENLDTVWPLLSASAQSLIDREGVAYTDREGDLVTSVVNNQDCVFTTPLNSSEGEKLVGCAFESLFRQACRSRSRNERAVPRRLETRVYRPQRRGEFQRKRVPFGSCRVFLYSQPE